MYVYEEEPSIKLLLKYIAACDLAYGLKERLLCFSRLTSQKSTTISVFTITAYLTNIAATIHYKSCSKTNVSPVWIGPWCIVNYDSKTKSHFYFQNRIDLFLFLLSPHLFLKLLFFKILWHPLLQFRHRGTTQTNQKRKQCVTHFYQLFLSQLDY